MEKVTYREFRARLKHYLDRVREGESFEVRGVRIGQTSTRSGEGEYAGKLEKVIEKKKKEDKNFKTFFKEKNLTK